MLAATMKPQRAQRAQRSANQALVYVLDDDAHMGAMAAKTLIGAGYCVRHFLNANAFRLAVIASRPDIVVLDLSLGEMDGVEVIRELSALSFAGRILLMSGWDQATLDEIKAIGTRHGLSMLPSLQKPFRPQHLVDRVATEASAPEPYSLQIPKPLEPNVRLEDALRKTWLDVWYQPKIDTKTHSVVGAEALVRANHPEFGIISPANLLPAPGDPLFLPMTAFVLERVVSDWRKLAEVGFSLQFCVNVPVSVMHDPAFLPTIRKLIPSDTRFPGLTIEITEDEAIRDVVSLREIVTQLKLYNIGVSIDDFGSGYASLGRLLKFPCTEIKLDRAFVSGCATDPKKQALCRSVIELAKNLNVKSCAEGVESEDDLRTLEAMGYDSVQGFLSGAPMPLLSLESFVRKNAAKALDASIVT